MTPATDAEQAVQILRDAGWVGACKSATHYGPNVEYDARHDCAINSAAVCRPRNPGGTMWAYKIADRNGRSLTDCARLIVETATREGWLPKAPAKAAARSRFVLLDGVYLRAEHVVSVSPAYRSAGDERDPYATEAVPGSCDVRLLGERDAQPWRFEVAPAEVVALLDAALGGVE